MGAEIRKLLFDFDKRQLQVDKQIFRSTFSAVTPIK